MLSLITELSSSKSLSLLQVCLVSLEPMVYLVHQGAQGLKARPDSLDQLDSLAVPEDQVRRERLASPAQMDPQEELALEEPTDSQGDR